MLAIPAFLHELGLYAEILIGLGPVLLVSGAIVGFYALKAFAAQSSLRSMLTHAPSAMAAFDRNGGLALWSEDYAEVLQAYGLAAQRGLPFKTIIGAASTHGLPFELPQGDGLADFLEQLGPIDFAAPDGLSYQARLQTMGHGGFVAVLTDVTELLELTRREAEAREMAETANHAKSAFLANMSHEIRTPLNGILGMAQVMAMGELPAAQRTRLEVIGQSGEALLAVLNGVLDLSKIEADKLELETRPFDLAQTVHRAAAAFEPLAAQKGVGFRFDIESRAFGTWRGDDVRIGQVLSNLLSNALKFTAAGEVGLRIRLVPKGLAFEVSDTGVGIAPDKLDLIFEAFTQADASTTRKYGGTGLGLAICRRFVELMGGELRVVSEEGTGSRFAFTLPLERDSMVAFPSRVTASAA